MNTDAMLRFTQRARLAVSLAQEQARRTGAPEISPLHMLIGLVKQGSINAPVFLNDGVELAQVYAILGIAHDTIPDPTDLPITHPALSDALKRIMERAVDEVRRLRHHTIDTPHLFLGVLSVNDSHVNQVLAALELTPDQIRERIIRSFDNPHQH